MATNQIQKFGLNSYGVRGVLKEYYRFLMCFFSLSRKFNLSVAMATNQNQWFEQNSYGL